MENNTIFRKKSMDRVSSPEELNDYLRVCSPGIWLVIAAVIILLVGVCIWGVMGHLDTTLTAAAVAEDQTLTVYIPEEELSSVLNRTFSIEGSEYEITDAVCSDEPIAVRGADFSEYVLHVSGLQVGEWVYVVRFDTELADGIYETQIVVDRVSPMSFVFN